LSKNEIRVQYSGFIIFAAQILSLVTGIVFTLLLTRNMSHDQYGVWSFIFAVIGPFTLLSGVFTFWATRFAARGKEGTIKTAVSANLIVGLVAAAVYLPLLAPVMSAFNIGGVYFLVYAIASLQIINTFLIAILEGCLRAVKPQAIGYGLLMEEVVKVTLAYVLIVGLKQLFLGAIISLIVGASVQAVFYVWLLTAYLRQTIRWNYLKEWLKGSAAFIYNAVGNQMVAFVLYLLVLYGGQAALGEYQAALTFATIIGYSASLTFALYPKMLSQECPEDVAESFKTMLMLAFPMAAIAITLSRSLLTILNASYSTASPILMLLTVDTLVVLVSQFYTQYLLGAETFDVEGKILLNQLVKSKIFKVFTLPYVQAAIALPAVYYVLTQVGFADSMQAVTYVVAINIIVHTITFIALYALTHGEVKIFVAWKSVGKYTLASLATAAVLLLLPHTTTLAATFGKVLIGAATYAALLLAIDANARRLVAQIWAEIRGVFHSG
jgi:O-antigen/teichoic acid export membrane protein